MLSLTFDIPDTLLSTVIAMELMLSDIDTLERRLSTINKKKSADIDKEKNLKNLKNSL